MCPSGSTQETQASQRCEVEINSAIVDRVTSNAHILETGTQSYRLAASSGRRPGQNRDAGKPHQRHTTS